MKIDIKPMSVNVAWQGKRFKTPEYKAYAQHVKLLLKPLELPEPPYTLVFEWGFSNPQADYDNPIKPFQDILQDYYGFNDRDIEVGIQIKRVVPKGEEYVKFRFLPAFDLSALFDIGENEVFEIVSE